MTSEQRNQAFNKFLTRGYSALNAQEIRALQADSGEAGGYLVAPQQFVDELIADIGNRVHIRQLATKFTITKAQSLGVPSLGAQSADPA